MKINENSVVYKYLIGSNTKRRLRGYGKPVSLCPLFWEVVYHSLCWIGLFLLGTILISSALYSVGYGIALYVFHVTWGAHGFMNFGLFVWRVVGALAIAIGLYILIDEVIKPYFENKKSIKQDKPQNQSIIIEYIKAKHRKVCPLVELIREKDEDYD